MERIHDHVVVATSQCVLPTAATAVDPTSPRITALQFTAINTGFEVVTFSADFRASANIQLRFPRGTPCHISSSSANNDEDNSVLQGDAPQLLLFECQVAPLERKTLVHVLKLPGKRAFVRVQFAFQNATSPAVHEIEHAQQHDEQAALQATKLAQSKYYTNSSSLPVHALGNTPQSIMRRCCDDINRFFRANVDDDEARFVDTSFPPKRTSLTGYEIDDGDDGSSEALYSLCSWKHLHDVMNDTTAWSLMTKDKQHIYMPSPPHSPQSGHSRTLPQLTDCKSPLPDQDTLVCALVFLAPEKAKWVKLWFGDQLLLSDGAESIQAITAVAVKICDRGMQWKQVVVDLYLPGFPIGSGLMAVSAPSSGGEIYAALVQKAYAKLKGSYAAINKVSTVTILQELTGLPWVNVYDSNRESQDDLSSSVRRATLQRLICRRYRNRHRRSRTKLGCSTQAALVVSFGRVGDHNHCAFPVLFGSEQNGITLQDVDNRIREVLGSSAKQTEPGSNGGNAGDERLMVVACDWSAFFKLEPRVWMVFTNYSKSKRKRVKFLNARHDESHSSIRPTCVQFAFSVAEMTSLVIVTQLEGERGYEKKESEPQHQLVLDAVGHDFSLTRIPTEASRVPSSGDELQLVTALGAGEYTLSVLVETTKTPSSSEKFEAKELLLTSEDSERNLQLLFNCIDQDMDGVISLEELQAFLRMHEDLEPSFHHNDDKGRSKSLDTVSFMDRFGSQDSSTGSSKELLADDLRDVYRSLAASSSVDEQEQDPAANHSAHKRYEELIWSDLCCVLRISDPARDYLSSSQIEPSDGEYDGRGDRASRNSTVIRVDDIQELRCCIHSDAPLVNFVRLPMPFITY